MKLKTLEVDGKTYAEVQDGKPVYVEDDGKEVAFDAPGTRNTISRLNAEAKSHREAKEAAEKALKGFEGIEDPAAAIKALETVALPRLVFGARVVHLQCHFNLPTV